MTDSTSSSKKSSYLRQFSLFFPFFFSKSPVMSFSFSSSLSELMPNLFILKVSISGTERRYCTSRGSSYRLVVLLRALFSRKSKFIGDFWRPDESIAPWNRSSRFVVRLFFQLHSNVYFLLQPSFRASKASSLRAFQPAKCYFLLLQRHVLGFCVT